MLKREEGYVGLSGLSLRGEGGSAVWKKREREPQAMWGGGQVNCRWCWIVALLIDKGAPLGEGRAPGGVW